MQKIINVLDKLSSSKLLMLMYKRLTIGSLTSLAGLRVSERLEATKLTDLGSFEDLKSLIKALKYQDINYVGVDNNILINLFNLVKIEDLKLFKIAIIQELLDDSDGDFKDLIDFNSFWEILVILLSPNHLERIENESN